MGHIELSAPVAHVWYTRRVPSYLGLLLDISRRNLDRVLYFAQYVVTYVDEDARQKALKRLEEKITLTEREQGAHSQDPGNQVRPRSAVRRVHPPQKTRKTRGSDLRKLTDYQGQPTASRRCEQVAKRTHGDSLSRHGYRGGGSGERSQTNIFRVSARR
jgi:DNA-directed RNA polymerase beta' subunit